MKQGVQLHQQVRELVHDLWVKTRVAADRADEYKLAHRA